jgi:hypothetical protein
MFGDGGDEFELGASAVEVVFRPVDSEVFITGQEVGEEPEADGEGDQFAGEDEVRAFGRGKELGGGLQVAEGEGFEHGHLDLDFREILFVLQGWAGGGAYHISEVIEDEPRHDRIEVEHTECLTCFPIEHDIIELGIVVGDPFRQIAGFEGVGQDIDDRLVFEGEVDLGRGEGRPIVRVGPNGFQQGIEAAPGVVEMGDGLEQALAWEVDQEMLEAPEGAAGLIGLARGLDRFERLGALDEDEGAPKVTGTVLVEGFSIASGDDGECFAGDVPSALGLQSMAQVGGHTDDIVHDRQGFLEDGLVDFLMDVTDEGATLVVGGHVGLVDVTNLARFGVEDVAVNLELL